MTSETPGISVSDTAEVGVSPPDSGYKIVEAAEPGTTGGARGGNSGVDELSLMLIPLYSHAWGERRGYSREPIVRSQLVDIFSTVKNADPSGTCNIALCAVDHSWPRSCKTGDHPFDGRKRQQSLAGDVSVDEPEGSRDRGDYPATGSLAARFRGANRPDVPAFVGLPAGTSYPIWYDVYGAGNLGNDFEPVDGSRVAGRFSMPEGIVVPRLRDRDRLRREFDRFRSRLDESPHFELHDRHTQAALDFVLGGAAERAFDVSLEPANVREPYGRDTLGVSALMTRRLIESGVTYVVLSDRLGSWDHPGDEVPQKGIDKGLR